VVNVPSVPEIITVNSEALQSQIRDLLPSQNGFGSELQASNVITPIIDLTRTAEGSSVPQNLQTAIAFGSQTAFDISNATTTVLNLTGFFRIFGIVNNVGAGNCTFDISDGASSKQILQYSSNASQFSLTEFDFVVFLSAGDSLSITSSSTSTVCAGSTRQLATGDGALINPVGFPL